MEELEFYKNGTMYECKLPITNGVVQVQMKGESVISVSGNLAGMKPSVMQVLRNPYSDSICFELNVPDGVEVTLRTQSEVLKAFYM